MITISTPPVLTGTEREQLAQLRAWLYRAATDLQHQLNLELEEAARGPTE